MLVPAIKYRDELQSIYHDLWFKERYMYWNAGSTYYSLEIDDNTDKYHQFASVDKNGKLLGYLSYSVDRIQNDVDSISLLNFSDKPNMTFSRDIGQGLKDIFERFRFRKVSFYVVVGNPIEKSYDKLIKRYGGRIVGIQKNHVKLLDGYYHDCKLYEIFREDYFENINRYSE